MIVKHDANRPTIKLFKHQEQIVDRYKDKLATEVALFMEMGTGKSATTLRIAEAKFLDNQIEGLLVIAPNDVHKQWYDDLVNGVDINHDGMLWQELSIDFEAQCVGGRGGSKQLYPFETKLFKFVSVNVDTFSQPTKWKEIVEWANSGKYMIAIDEATCIKNPSSKRSQRLLYEFNDVKRKGKAILSSVKHCPYRAVLTGTPVTNGPIDLWSIMEFIKPNFFGMNYYNFRTYYGLFTQLEVNNRLVPVLLTENTWNGIKGCSSYEAAFCYFGCTQETYMIVKHQDHFEGAYKNVDELKEKLNTVATFIKLRDCQDMPEQIYITRQVGLSDNQKEAYKTMKKELLAEFGDYLMVAKNRLVMSVRLQEISSGFIVAHKDIVDEEQDLNPDEVVWLDEMNPKLEALMRDVEDTDKPLLILTRYSAEASKIYDLCKQAGYRTGLFTGWKVDGGVDAFKEGKLDILVANSNKISRGFNLQIAHTTLFYSNSFSMEVRQQAEFRTFRTGQKHSCLYVDYVASEVDKTISKALKDKKGMLDYIRNKEIEEIF